MNRIAVILLNISVALYLFANGIVGIAGGKWYKGDGEFVKMLETLSIKTGKGFGYVLLITLSVCAIAAGVFLLLAIFEMKVPITDLILLIFVVLWVVFIVVVDIVAPLKKSIEFLDYLLQITPHLMVLGALVSANKRFA